MNSILITGGGGYIGTMLTETLLKHGHKVTCVDRLFFGIDKIAQFLPNPNYTLIQDDSRTMPESVMQGIDVVVDMAALSNDPLGELVKCKTEDINYKARLRTNAMAKKAGVKKYILISSCSVYGAQDDICTEETKPNPVSTYAVCNVKAEEVLKNATKDFCVTALRLATVFGQSYRMRFDLAVNVMTMRAFKNNKIIVLGQGLQWRPLVHVKDVCRAVYSVIQTEPNLVNGEVFNVGRNDNNKRIINVAYLIRETLPFETEVEIAPGDPDRRDYKVNFDKIGDVLNYHARYDIKCGITEIYEGLKQGIIWDYPDTVTVKWYKHLMDADEKLKAIKKDGVLL